jgi:hypothetical protein
LLVIDANGDFRLRRVVANPVDDLYIPFESHNVCRRYSVSHEHHVATSTLRLCYLFTHGLRRVNPLARGLRGLAPQLINREQDFNHDERDDIPLDTHRVPVLNQFQQGFRGTGNNAQLALQSIVTLANLEFVFEPRE